MGVLEAGFRITGDRSTGYTWGIDRSGGLGAPFAFFTTGSRFPSYMLIFSLREQIVEQLRNDVLCGRLAEGERLSELKLVERFGVSRTPIREALQQLMHEGLLEGRPNAGVKVAKRPPDAIRELVVPIRRSVETYALRSYFSHITAEDYARWNEILKKLKQACKAGDFPAIAEYDIEFHRSIVRRANQKDLEAIWMSLISRVRSHFWQTQRKNYANPVEIHNEHARIVEAFHAGDVEAAVKALEENIA
jgi:DNA-binding GntR family transcriptional regulator